MAAIWAVGILALLFATYTAASRYRAIEAHSLVRHAEAEALADAGLNLAIVDVLAGLPGGRGGARYGRTGQVFACSYGDRGRLALSVADEGGKVDLNASSPELIDALLRAVEPARGRAIARDILDIRAAHIARSGANRNRQPTFRSVRELEQIDGVDARTFASLLPFVTVHSRSGGIDPEVAPASLLAALSPQAAAGAGAGGLGVPVAFVAPSSGRTFLVSVDAATSGARASIEAVVEISPDSAAPYTVLERRRGGSRPSSESAPRDAAC